MTGHSAVGRQRIRGRKIFVASGARPTVPDLKGLESIDYLTNETVLDLQERPPKHGHYRRRLCRC